MIKYKEIDLDFARQYNERINAGLTDEELSKLIEKAKLTFCDPEMKKSYMEWENFFYCGETIEVIPVYVRTEFYKLVEDAIRAKASKKEGYVNISLKECLFLLKGLDITCNCAQCEIVKHILKQVLTSPIACYNVLINYKFKYRIFNKHNILPMGTEAVKRILKICRKIAKKKIDDGCISHWGSLDYYEPTKILQIRQNTENVSSGV